MRPFPISFSRPRLLVGALLLITAACEARPEGPMRIVDAAIERHGGERFENSRIRFYFRDAEFDVIRDSGRFRYLRITRDAEGREVVEGMDNDGTWMHVDGFPVPLDDARRLEVETAVNSVVYFSFLPFRLRDPSVRLRGLGTAEVAGESYDVVEVTFREEGGGDAWEDRFVHWFHQEANTLDFLAHEYLRDGGGARFRRATNRREVGGLLIQDFENYAATEPIEDVVDFPRRWEAGTLNLLSMIELEGVVVERVDGAPFDREDPPPVPVSGAVQALEIQLGIAERTYPAGGRIDVTLQLANRSLEPARLRFPTSQRVDFMILTPTGDEVFRWSAEQAFLQVLGEEILEPEGERRFEAELPAPAPGSYQLRGVITASGADLWATLPLEVVAIP